MFNLLTKKYKIFFKNGLYLDLFYKNITNWIVKNIFINLFQFFGEKYLIEYVFRFSIINTLFLAQYKIIYKFKLLLLVSITILLLFI